MDNNGTALVLMTMILGGFGLVAFALRGRQRMRELVMKERIAMIEKGLVPAPEADPARFERLVGRSASAGTRQNAKGARYRSAGVMLIGLGAALFLLIGFTAGVVAIAFGVGGAFVVLGLAVLVNGLWLPAEPVEPPPSSSIAPPPPNVGP